MVFWAEKRQPGWKERKYAHSGSLTKTLFEHYDCSDKALPEPGYRPPEFIRVIITEVMYCKLEDARSITTLHGSGRSLFVISYSSVVVLLLMDICQLLLIAVVLLFDRCH